MDATNTSNGGCAASDARALSGVVAQHWIAVDISGVSARDPLQRDAERWGARSLAGVCPSLALEPFLQRPPHDLAAGHQFVRGCTGKFEPQVVRHPRDDLCVPAEAIGPLPTFLAHLPAFLACRFLGHQFSLLNLDVDPVCTTIYK